jgi:hypothetical protein
MKKVILLLTIISHFAFGQNNSAQYNAPTKTTTQFTGVMPKAKVWSAKDTSSGKSPIFKFETGRIKYKNLVTTTDTINYDKVLVVSGDSTALMSRSFFGGGGSSATIDTLKVGSIQQGRGTSPIFMYFNGTAWVRNDTSYAPKASLLGYVPVIGSDNMSGYFRTIEFGGLRTGFELAYSGLNISAESSSGKTYTAYTSDAMNVYSEDLVTPANNRNFRQETGEPFVFSGDIAKYNSDRNSQINLDPLALITKSFADSAYAGGGTSDTAKILLTYVKYAESITKGQAVYVSGGSGTNILVSKADNTTEATSSKTLGLVLTSGATNFQGKVITDGILDGLNTNTATIGDPVWLGTSGNLIFGLANKPVAPAHLVYIGVVTRVSSTVGEIFVKIQNGFELNEIHDVLLTSLVNNDVLTYESSTGLWKNKQVSLTNLTLNDGQIPIGDATNKAFGRTLSGDVTVSNTGVVTLASVNSNVGTFGSATQTPVLVTNAKGLITSVSNTTITPAIGSVTGLGSGVSTWLATPSSANLRGAISDETGTGVAVFGTTPTFTTNITTPLIIGGTGTTSSLTYRTTTEVGTTNADHIFQVGNNGATEAMRILNSGNIGIGIASPLTKFQISDGNSIAASFSGTYNSADLFLTGNSSVGLRYVIASNTSAAGGLVGYAKSRGTVTSPTAVNSGDFLGGQLFGGHDGTQVNFGAAIYSFCDGTPSSGLTPARISMFTGSSSATRTERIRIESNGDVGIGTITPQSIVDVEGGIAIGATYSGTTAAPTNGAIIEGNVGIGTSAPNARLHVVGDSKTDGLLIYSPITINLVNFTYPAFNFIGLLTKTYIRLNVTVGIATIEAFPAPSDNVVLIISCVGSFGIIFRNEWGGAAAADRFLTNTGADVVVPVNGTITFVYDTISSRWRQI